MERDVKTLNAFCKSVRDTITTMSVVNREVAAVDPFFVAWSWLTQVFTHLQMFAIIIGGSFVLESLRTRPITGYTIFGGLAAYALYLVLHGTLSTLYSERQSLFQRELNARMQRHRIQHMSSLDLGRQVDPKFKELMNMLEYRGSRAVWGMWYSQIMFVAAFVALCTGAVVLLRLDWILSALALMIALPNIVQRWLGEQKQRVAQEEDTLLRRRRDEIFDALTKPDSAILMRLLRYTGALLKRYDRHTIRMLESFREVMRYERRLSMYTALISLVAIGIFGGYFALEFSERNYTLTELGAIVGSFQALSGAIEAFGWAITGMDQERRDFDYWRQFLETRPLVDESACEPIHLEQTPVIRLDHVSFSYPGSSAEVVRDCALTIPPGEKVAFVGPNGSGKTTLLRLISRIYLPSGGEIFFDEYAISRATQDSLLTHLTMISQGSTLPGMEINFAITGSEEAEIDRQRFEEAQRASRSNVVFQNLPRGDRTCIGEEWPDGCGFSTGERQRFVLAAAMYRLLAPNVYIAAFDEPTANCDAETKEAFYETITKSTTFASKTILVALHDPIYLHLFDRVIHFENGEITEDLRGTERIVSYRDRIIHSLSADL